MQLFDGQWLICLICINICINVPVALYSVINYVLFGSEKNIIIIIIIIITLAILVIFFYGLYEENPLEFGIRKLGSHSSWTNVYTGICSRMQTTPG